jgi:GGDEF domain-containing protein
MTDPGAGVRLLMGTGQDECQPQAEFPFVHPCHIFLIGCDAKAAIAAFVGLLRPTGKPVRFQLFKRADEALYRVKRGGKNRVSR